MEKFENFAKIIDLSHVIVAAEEDLDVNQTIPEYIAAHRNFKPGTSLADLYATHKNGWLHGSAGAFRTGVSPAQCIAFHLVDHLA